MGILQIRLTSMLLCAAVLLAMTGKAQAQGALPRVISTTQLEQYLRYVDLSEAQSAEVKRLHEAYGENWHQAFGKDIAIFNAKWSAAYRSPERFEGRSMAEAFQAANDQADRLKYRLKAANDFFFDQVEAILSEEQVPGLQRARLAHDRFSYRRSKHSLREMPIDLVALIEQMQFSDEEKPKVEAFLRDFEPVYIEALRDAAEVGQRRAAIEFQILDVDRTMTGSVPVETINQEIDALRHQAGKISFNAFKRLVETNRRGLNQFRNVLTPESGVELQRRFDESAYPEVYPDPAIADSVFAAAKEIPGLNEDQLIAMDALASLYSNDHTALSKRMATTLFEQALIFYRGDDENRQKEQLKSIEFKHLGEKRENLNLAQPARVRAILSPEQSAQLPAWKYEKAAPPRPWDPRARREPKPPRQPTSQPATQPATRPQ